MIIREAIEGRHLLGFMYHGMQRVVEPHTYGLDARGRKVLVGYQVAGEASEPLPGWRSFREKEMADLTLLEQKFYAARPGYRYNDGAFRTILGQLPATKSGR
jgi:hypothetical protein